MTALTLLHPICSLDKQVSLPTGTVLSKETLEALISSSDAASESSSVLRHTSVEQDLRGFLNQPPYNVIFDDQRHFAEVLDLIDGVDVIVPVLQSLDYFREYDFNTYRHILVVSALSTLLAKDLVSDDLDRIHEVATGPAHDFGKTCVPLRILKKTDPLTPTERSILKQHTAAGYALLSYYLKDSETLAAKVARDQHERKDRSGYPRGIGLHDPMVEIVTVCDVYDALISPGPYQPISYDNRSALEEVTAMAQRNEIGWTVVQALVARNRKSKPHYSECLVSQEERGAPPPGNVYGLTAEEKERE
jgi:HD-GYP domain-containing protein (c-di-GMP phosphodiesterase class II)